MFFFVHLTYFQIYILISSCIDSPLDTKDAPAQSDDVRENLPSSQFFSGHNDVEDVCLLSLDLLGNRTVLLRSWIVGVYSERD